MKMDSNSNCDPDSESLAEISEQQPLQASNGVSNGQDGYPHIVPARKKRLPPRFELDDETHNWRKADSSPSPSPSPSPSSPYKKKLVFTMPGIMRPKKPRENKLRAFVVFMFFVIVLMMSLTYVYHQQYLLKIMQLTVGEQIKFTEDDRILHLSNEAKQDVLTARLGTSILTNDLPRDCHDDSEAVPVNETACLEWVDLAKMKVERFLTSESAKCYQVHWQAMRKGLSLKDCFDMDGAHWYGMGEFNPQLWPMDLLNTNETAFITGNISRDVFGHILEGYWVTSKGVAIMANLSLPLHVVIDHDVVNPLGLCLLAKSSEKVQFPILQYTLCSSWDMKEVHEHVMEKLKPKSPLPHNGSHVIDNIVWSTKQKFGLAINSSTLLSFAEEVQKLDIGNAGTILIDSHWQAVDGDFTFNPELFGSPGPKETISSLNNRGLKVVLSVHPYVSTSSRNYYRYLDRNYWVRDISRRVPNLIRWNHIPSAVLIDFTNENASEWFRDVLERLRGDYKVQSFQFRGVETSSLPPYATFHRPLLARNSYSQLYNGVATKFDLAFSVSVSSQFPELSSFVELSPRHSTWSLDQGLRSIIPAVLSTGIVGAPFILTGPVGGETSVGLPERELYVRWLQLASFFPVLQMSILPSDYDEEVLSIAKKLIQFRRSVVVPELKIAIAEAESFGSPIIRPLWWIAPNDSDAQNTKSEFLVGNNILVAPMLDPHEDQRDIYLPPGLWQDRDNKHHKGGKWLYDHRSPLNKVAYFIRLPETRSFTV